MSEKYALVIGGTGFISTHCVDELAKAGYNVTIMTRGSTPDIHGNLVKTRLKVDCEKRKLFVSALQSSLHDMATHQKLSEAPSKWDVVIDFICFDAPHAEDVVAGITGLCKSFVLISTDSIYEVCKPQPGMEHIDFPGRTEDHYDLLNVSKKRLEEIDDYGYNKWLAEDVFIKATPALPYVALRLPDVMGEREYPRSRHLQYQMRVMLGLPIYINPQKQHYSAPDISPHFTYKPESKPTAKPARISFVYAGDVGSAVVCIANQAIKAERGEEVDTWKGIVGEAFNIGSFEQVTMKEYVDMIGETLGKTPYYFSSGNQRLATIKYSQHLNNNIADEQECKVDAATQYTLTNPPATSYTRILTKLDKFLPDSKVDIAAAAGALTSERANELLLKFNLRPWSKHEDPEYFVRSIVEKGYELDSESSSDESSSDSDNEEGYTNKKKIKTAYDNERSSSQESRRVGDLSMKKVVRREQDEDDDMYSYLPSVDQGPILIKKAIERLPGWTPTPLIDWCRRMTIWYAHCDAITIADNDARIRLNKMIMNYTRRGYTF